MFADKYFPQSLSISFVFFRLIFELRTNIFQMDLIKFCIFFSKILGEKYLRSASRDGGSTQARLGATSGVIDTRFASANHQKYKKGFVKKQEMNSDEFIKILFLCLQYFLYEKETEGGHGGVDGVGGGGDPAMARFLHYYTRSVGWD